MMNNTRIARAHAASEAAAAGQADYATLRDGYRAADEVVNDALVSTPTRDHALTLRARLAVALSRY